MKNTWELWRNDDLFILALFPLCHFLFEYLRSHTNKILFSVHKGFFCGKTLLELFVWKWIHQIRNVTLKVNFVLYPRVFRSCGYKMHTIEKIFEKINVLRNVVIRNLYFIFRLKIHGVINTQKKSAKVRRGKWHRLKTSAMFHEFLKEFSRLWKVCIFIWKKNRFARILI